MADRIQFRRDTAARWSSINPILMEGEIGLETDTNHIKIGNGSSAWNNLEYGIGMTNITSEYGGSTSLAASQEMASNNYWVCWPNVWPPISTKTNDNNTISIIYNQMALCNVWKYSMHPPFDQTVTLPTVGIYLIYFAQKDRKVYGVHYGNNTTEYDTSDCKVIQSDDNPIFIGIVDGGTFHNTLSLFSRWWGTYEDDMSIEGMVRRLLPENRTHPVIFLKHQWNIEEHPSTTDIDIRLSEVLHNKHRSVYVRGILSQPIDTSTDCMRIYIKDHGTNTNYAQVDINVNEDGSFEGSTTWPESVWGNINLERGYELFVILFNYSRHNVSMSITEAWYATYPNDEQPCINTKKALLWNKIMNVDVDNVTYGVSSYSLSSYFPIAPHVGYYCTTTNSACEKDGYLQSISVSYAGSHQTFGVLVGLLDQYSRFVVSQQFTLQYTGAKTYDVSSLHIPIKKGEQIAISATSVEEGGGNMAINYNENDETYKDIENKLIYGNLSSTWAELATTYGGRINLSYEVASVDTPFANSTDIDSIESTLSAQETKINSLQYVYDENNTPYKVVVRNGNLTLKSLQYKKALCLGNSLTSHGYAENIGYYGDGSWAMASTNKTTTTWSTHLQTVLKEKQNEVTCTPFNIFSWETNYMNVDLDTLFESHKDINYDLIIFRAGENGSAGSDYSQGVDRLFSYLIKTFPNAEIVITDMFWSNVTKENAYKEIASKYNLKYVYFPKSINDKAQMGQMLMGVDNVLHPIVCNGVANHCTDVCFFDFANILAEALGYQTITGKYNVNISTTKEYSINSNYQIKDGYVSILTYSSEAPTILVKDASGNAITTTNHDMSTVTWIDTPSEAPTWVTTFIMPSSDVTVTF